MMMTKIKHPRPKARIGSDVMTSTQRSQRFRDKHKILGEAMRSALTQNAETLLAAGHALDSLGRADLAKACFQAAERGINAANANPDAPLVITELLPAGDEAVKLREQAERASMERQLAAMGYGSNSDDAE